MKRTRRQQPDKEKRHRSVAHLWADKRVVRLFRKNFSKRDYKNLRSTYLALCEIESDFTEGQQIKGFTKTVATYAGIGEELAFPCLRALRQGGFIDYSQQHDEST